MNCVWGHICLLPYVHGLALVSFLATLNDEECQDYTTYINFCSEQ